jgi:tRNA threonylcarbamoyladenosine biosynthesis protein TsaB
MLVLAVDTSGRSGSIALADYTGEPGACQVIESVALAGGNFSAELVPAIAGLLSKRGHPIHQLGGFSVVSGPGSFTGLRIGLAAIKAFAEITGKPIAAVSLLEVLAMSGGTAGRVLAVIPAGRSEFFVGEYELRGASANLIAERLLGLTALLDAAAGSVVVTSDHALVAWVRARAPQLPEILVKEVSSPGAQEIASLGCDQMFAGRTVTAASLEANYIRRSDPELLRDQQLGVRGS